MIAEKNRLSYLIYVILTINKHMNNDTVSHDMGPVIWNKLKLLLQTPFSWLTAGAMDVDNAKSNKNSNKCTRQ